MIQDIAPHRLGNQYDPAAVPEQEDYALCFDSGRVLLRTGETAQMLRVKDFPENGQFVYLFTVDDNRFLSAVVVRASARCADPNSGPARSCSPFSRGNIWRTGTGTPGIAAAAENP